MKRYSGSKDRFRLVNSITGIIVVIISVIVNSFFRDTGAVIFILAALTCVGVYMFLIWRIDTSVFDIEVNDQFCQGPKDMSIHYGSQRVKIKLDDILEVQRKGWWEGLPAHLTVKGKNKTAIHIRLDYFSRSEAEAITETILQKDTDDNRYAFLERKVANLEKKILGNALTWWVFLGGGIIGWYWDDIVDFFK